MKISPTTVISSCFLISGLGTFSAVFSKDFLDYASKLLIEKIDFESLPEGPILDVGCGYGPIGIYAAKCTKMPVFMVDINPRALELSKENVLKNIAYDLIELRSVGQNK